MHRVRVFLNGAASSSGAFDWREKIHEFLFRSQVDFVSPSSQEAMKEELERASREKIDVVISVGGDGTFNTLIQTLAKTDTTFLVVPAGTANDLARELGITPKLRKALECIRKNEIHKIDLISINGRCMATNGGIGVVSDVALSVNDLRNRIPGFRTLMKSLHHRVYGVALAAHLMARHYRHYRVRIRSAQYDGELRTPLLLINNQPYIAGTFPVAPETNNSDGKFNVTVFAHDDWAGFISTIIRVKRGLPVDHDPKVISFETDRVEIELLDGPDFTFFGDGEFLAQGRRLDVKIQPQALNVFRLSIPCFKRPEEFTTVSGVTP
jgi:diacylglycerol kinase (ATP)